MVKTAPSSNKQNAPVVLVAKSEMPCVVGGAKGRRINKYAILVKETMQGKNLKLLEASKYIKEHNLYKKDS